MQMLAVSLVAMCAVASQAAVVASGQSSSTATTPVQKTLELLEDLQKRIIAEGVEADKDYVKEQAFFKDHSKDLKFAIQTEVAEEADLTAQIQEAEATAAILGTKIEDLGQGATTTTNDLAAAKKLRSTEAADFTAEEKELTEIIDTLERAIGILEREAQKGAASMLQIKGSDSVIKALTALTHASLLSSADVSRLTALVQQSKSASIQDEGDDADNMLSAVGAPDSVVYENHSDDIISTLESLLEEAQEQLSELRKQEASAIHNFKMLEQSLQDEIKNLNKDMAKAKGSLSETTKAKADAASQLEATRTALKTDKEALAELETTFTTKAKDYEIDKASRAEELKALADAHKVVTEMTGGAEKLAYGLNQFSLLQLARHTNASSGVPMQVSRFVRELAEKERLPELVQLANRIASLVHHSVDIGADPFAKVKGLITDLIKKLGDEQSAEATKKAWCDENLKESNTKKDELTKGIAKLTTSIESMTAKSTELKEQVAEIQHFLSKLTTDQADMDAMRKRESKDYMASKADLEMGLQGVAIAMRILKDYYGKDAAHDAAEGAGTTLIGLLEVVESDFSKSLAELSATEQAALSAYEEDTKENSLEKLVKEQDLKYKTKESASLDKAVSNAQGERQLLQQQLDAVMEVINQLEEECIAKPESYEDRQKHRSDEIAGLKSALEILESEGTSTAPLLQTGAQDKRRVLRGSDHAALSS